MPVSLWSRSSSHESNAHIIPQPATGSPISQSTSALVTPSFSSRGRQAKSFQEAYFSADGGARPETEGMQRLRRLCSGLAAPGGVDALLTALQVRRHRVPPCASPILKLRVVLALVIRPRTQPLEQCCTEPLILEHGASSPATAHLRDVRCRMTRASPPSSSSTAAQCRASSPI